MKCERCKARRAVWACVDEPENEGAGFGDEVLGLALCTLCLELAEVDGPWDLVTRLDGPRQGCGVTRPLLLDAYCGAGGASVGYHRAGFEVVGVDHKPQPNYPFRFIQADALEYLAAHGHECDAIHASPPCQAYSTANNTWGRTDHPQLIEATREALRATGLPYVIENVEGARRHLVDPVMVCGLSLGLNVKRHRLFECSFPAMVPPCSGHERDYLSVFGGSPRRRAKQIGRTAKDGPMLRRGTATLAEGRAAMGIDWMRREEMSEAIPPLYTELIGGFLLAAVNARAAA